MIKLKDLLFEEGCSSCSRPKAPLLTESTNPEKLSEHILYHVYNKLPLVENTFRYGSEAFLNLWQEARWLHTNNQIKFDGADEELLKETDLGRFDFYEGRLVPLDLLLEYEDDAQVLAGEPISEKVKTDKKHPTLGKPKRGGSKKFYVYVKDPKTKRIKKVSFGAPGMSVGFRNPKRRKAFAARHKCAQKTDRTKASYWACRIGRYAKGLGLGNNFSGFW